MASISSHVPGQDAYVVSLAQQIVERIGRKRVDFVIEEVMVELKAKGELEDVDVIQAPSYLKASGVQVGLLLNFGGKSLAIKRLIHTALPG